MPPLLPHHSPCYFLLSKGEPINTEQINLANTLHAWHLFNFAITSNDKTVFHSSPPEIESREHCSDIELTAEGSPLYFILRKTVAWKLELS